MNEADRTPRILITRLSAVGDCILTLPLACALREHFPAARVIWAVEPLSASLLSRHPAVDRLLVVPRRWLTSPHLVRVLRERLRALRVDVALDPQSLTKSSLLGWFSGAPRRIGFARPQGRELAPWVNNEHVVRGATHLVDASLRLLAPLGVTNLTPRFDIPLLVDAEATIDAFLREAHLTGGYAVANSAASRVCRQWPADRFGRVARHLGEEHDLPTVVTWGSAREAEIAAQIVAKGGGHAVPAPRTTLPQLAALLRRARLMIASDTGPLHLAAALGVACLGLYGPTRHENSGPYGPGHVAIQADAIPVRSHNQRYLDDSAMRQITVEQVCAAADAMLARRLSQQPHAA